ncbi:MAG TPA: CPBP family intramembrane glutamic endopeptidase [Bryobacteraceae bacterium]|nr:CPBP family intramembrane glutamic endopeptidase [Bryobacteraceae bacterium]
MPTAAPDQPSAFATRHPVASYFMLAFVMSWCCASAVVVPQLRSPEPLPKSAGILLFSSMLLGPILAGLGLTRVLDGKSGLRDLGARMLRWRVGARWYLPLLLPPALILIVLFSLGAFHSPVFAPNFVLLGILFGIPAGVFEEIGWTGFALPRMIRDGNALKPAILLGLLWGTWHLPIINYLGAATPHGAYWLAFFLAFTAAMTAMRVLIAWIYVNTRSVLLSQLMHISSTSSLVIFSPGRISPAQETLWYAAYAAALWLTVALITLACGQTLTRQSGSTG